MKFKEKDGEFVIVDFDEFQAYRIACEIEKEGIKFYEQLLSWSDKPGAKATLQFLINEEKRHLEFFTEQLIDLRRTREELSEDNDLLQGMDFGIFRPYRDTEELSKAVDRVGSALRLAVMIEEKSLRFYEACLKELTSLKTKRGLKKIVEEETRHKDKLEGMLNSL